MSLVKSDFNSTEMSVPQLVSTFLNEKQTTAKNQPTAFFDSDEEHTKNEIEEK